jgi:hypothetical protein
VIVPFSVLKTANNRHVQVGVSFVFAGIRRTRVAIFDDGKTGNRRLPPTNPKAPWEISLLSEVLPGAFPRRAPRHKSVDLVEVDGFSGRKTLDDGTDGLSVDCPNSVTRRVSPNEKDMRTSFRQGRFYSVPAVIDLHIQFPASFTKSSKNAG